MMMNSLRKMFMNSETIRTSPKHMKFLNGLLGYAERYADKYFMRGSSKHGSVTVKITPMMSIKEIKIYPEALIDPSKAPKESMEYLRIFCDVIEKEITSAYNDAQAKLYKKVEKSSYDLNNAEK
jgi:DNA-binding protein YbaB